MDKVIAEPCTGCTYIDICKWYEQVGALTAELRQVLKPTGMPVVIDVSCAKRQQGRLIRRG